VELVETHWKLTESLAEKKTQVMIDEERRASEARLQNLDRRAVRWLEDMRKLYSAALRTGLGLMPYVPRAVRQDAIERIDAPDQLKQHFIEAAANAEDWSGGVVVGNLGEIARLALVGEERREAPAP
jgi:hypothetical protein